MKLIAALATITCACGRFAFDPVAASDAAPIGDTTDAFAPACGQRDVELVPESGMVSFTQSTLSDDAAGSCGGGGSVDAVYAIEVPTDAASLIVAADLTGGLDTLIHVRRDCTDPTTEVICDPRSGWDDGAAYRLIAPGAGFYYVFIEELGGASQTDVIARVLLGAGESCAPAIGREVCGPGLECTTGACVAASCTPAVNGTLNAISESFTVDVDTSGTTNHHAGSCGQGIDGGVRANEAIVRVQLTTTAALRVSTDDMATSYDTLIYVRDACAGTELACDDDSGGIINTTYNTSVATTPTLAPGIYLVFIDGFSIHKGAARVRVSAQ